MGKLMQFTETRIEGCFVIQPLAREDERGWFARVYGEEEFSEIGFTKRFVQINQSFNKQKATLRGLHYQQPYPEIKLVRCITGGIWDVVVDLRKDSKTFLKWEAAELNETNLQQMLIPEGCAHGFITLRENTSIIYHHTEFYHPESESGIHYTDPKLNISWPLQPSIISERDRLLPFIEKNFTGVHV